MRSTASSMLAPIMLSPSTAMIWSLGSRPARSPGVRRGGQLASPSGSLLGDEDEADEEAIPLADLMKSLNS